MITEEPHALAILTRLRTVTMAGQALRVGDAVAPKSSDGAVVAPCAVVYGREGGSLTGSLGSLDTDGEIVFQVTSVGKTASEARTVADKTTAALGDSEIPVPGRWIAWCRKRNSPGSRVDRDDEVTPPLFYVITQYRMLTLAAS